MSDQPIVIREPDEADRAWLDLQLRSSWGSTTIVSRGQAHDASRARSLVAARADERVGLATFRCEHRQCELLPLVGEYGIPLDDELEFERLLDSTS